MSLYDAFADAIRRRLHFIDRFRTLAGVESNSLASFSSLMLSADVDEWILDPRHRALHHMLVSVNDPLVTLVLRQSQKWALEFAARLKERPLRLGNVISTRLLNSDPHLSGILIAIEFETGQFVYKPRSVKLDLAYNNIIKKLCSIGAKFVPRPIDVLDCGEYGYIEYVEPRMGRVTLRDDEICNLGAILAVIYLMAGKDFHYENVIFSENGPATLVDLEGLLQPDFVNDDLKKANHVSILSTGILPARLSVGSFDFDPSIMGSNVYNMGAELSCTAIKFATAFRDTYNCILKNRNLLQAELSKEFLVSSHTRVLVSSTIDYYRAISRYIYYDALGKGQIFLEGIRSSNRFEEAFLKEERRAISHLCVPVFLSTNRKKGIVSESGAAIAAKIRSNGLEKVVRRVGQQMTSADLERQIWFIWMSFELHARNNGIECAVKQPAHRTVGQSAKQLARAATRELRRLNVLMKMGRSGSHIIVYPAIEDGLWVLKDRRMNAQEQVLWRSVVEIIRIDHSDKYTIRRDRLVDVVHALQALSRTERCSGINDARVGEFLISAWCGPCADLFDAFLGAESNAASAGAAFVAHYNDAAGRGAVVFPGRLQSRNLVFANGTMSLIVAMLVVRLLTEEAQAGS